MKKKYFILLLTFLLAGNNLLADVRMPEIFSDHMVLQRHLPVTIWGWADPGERVRLSIADQMHSVRADRQGNWRISLDPMEAGGPFVLTVQGKNTLHLHDILVGEVWLCSGQSNMVWTVSNSANPEEEITQGDHPNIRMITVPRIMGFEPADDIGHANWKVCTPANVGEFSAVAYYFGRHLQQELGVPIGLINSSWGGTVVEAWMSKERVSDHPDFSEKMRESASAFFERMETEPHPNQFPSMLYNGMIYPIKQYTINGTIWYQGESNAPRAYQYRTLFPAMIEDWRKQWDRPDMPFLFVQLANFRAPALQPVDDPWAELREAQFMTLSLPFTGMAVTIDIGEADDIHPKNKQDVGLRLALHALHMAYGRNLVYSGPMYDSMQVENNLVRLRFSHTGSGLFADDKYGYLKGFAIAGNDRVFHWAKAKLQGNEVVVYSDAVKDPVAVRYAWAINPDDANLYNKEGLPASPFRTDDWPGITLHNK